MQQPKPSEHFRFIGTPLPRKEDARLTTGAGRFSDDFSVPGQCYLAVVRSPHPHAHIRNVDFSAARALPGVVATFGGADCLAAGLNPIPHDPLPKTKFDMKLHAPGGGAVFIGPHLLLPADKARHVGEAVAAVVAETQAQALDAAEAVVVDYEELPFVLHSEDAMKPEAPLVWAEAPLNTPVDTWFGDPAATDAAFASADHVVAMDFHIDRVTGVPLEPRAALANSTSPPAATRCMPAAAARCDRRTSSPACSASRRSGYGCSPTTLAAISAPATVCSWNSAWCCGPRASCAGR